MWHFPKWIIWIVAKNKKNIHSEHMTKCFWSGIKRFPNGEVQCVEEHLHSSEEQFWKAVTQCLQRWNQSELFRRLNSQFEFKMAKSLGILLLGDKEFKIPNTFAASDQVCNVTNIAISYSSKTGLCRFLSTKFAIDHGRSA